MIGRATGIIIFCCICKTYCLVTGRSKALRVTVPGKDVVNTMPGFTLYESCPGIVITVTAAVQGCVVGLIEGWQIAV